MVDDYIVEYYDAGWCRYKVYSYWEMKLAFISAEMLSGKYRSRVRTSISDEVMIVFDIKALNYVI